MFIVSAAVFLTTFLIVKLMADFLTSSERKTQRRLQETLGSQESLRNEYTVSRVQKVKSSAPTSTWLQGIMNTGFIQDEKRLLEQSGLPFKIEEYLRMCLLIALVIGFIGFLISRAIMPSLLLGIVSVFFPGLWVRMEKNRRITHMENQLMHAVTLMASSLRSGHSFMQALELISHETPAPLGNEFRRAMRDIRMGARLEEALGSFAERMDSREIEMMVTGILVQREVGGNLAEILDIIADTIDKRVKMKAKVHSLTAQGRLSGWIVTLLPVALILLIYVPNPDYGQVMMSEPLGRIMMEIGIAMLILGAMLIKKVVNVDV